MTTPTPQLKHLFTPLKIGAFTVKNRIVSTGHLSNFAVAGLPSERHFNYWVTKARGGVGLIVTEDQAVHPSGGSESFVIQAYREECVEPFRRITSAVHEHGTKMVAQLFHPGATGFRLAKRACLSGPWGLSQPTFTLNRLMRLARRRSRR